MQGYRFRVGDDLEASPPLAPGPIVGRQGEVDVLGRGQASELHLEFLPAEDVAPYVAERLGAPIAPALAVFVHERTDGNALFLVNIVEHLVQQGVVSANRLYGCERFNLQNLIRSLARGA